MVSEPVLPEIERVLEEAWLVDTHEHLYPPGFMAPVKDLPNLLKKSWSVADFISAGMSPQGWEEVSEAIEPERAQRQLSEFLAAAGNTSVFRYLLRSLEELYGIAEADLARPDWAELSERVRRANERPDWFQHVLRDRAHVRVCLLDHYYSVPPGELALDRNLLVPVLRVDDFLMGSPNLTRNPGNAASDIARRLGRGEIAGLTELTGLVDEAFERYAAQGGKAVKICIAYSRPLTFEGVSRAEAAHQFDRVLAGAFSPDLRRISDFMLGHCIERAIEYGLPIQIHTGMQAGNAAWLEDARPTHLTNLFLWYPKARFVLLHGGFPFAGEAGVLAKAFPNVYLDFTWIPLLSPAGARRALSEWVEMVPGNKLMWGGDAHVVEELYSAVLALRDLLGSVLSEKVRSGYLTVDAATSLARRIMAGNAARLFRLDL